MIHAFLYCCLLHMRNAKGYDANSSLDTHGVFVDISKAFDKVWHEGLIFKLQSYDITGSLLSLLKDFLSNRLQRVVLNG